MEDKANKELSEKIINITPEEIKELQELNERVRLEHLAEPYINQVNREFCNAKKDLEKFLKFPITNIEAVELRRIIMHTVELSRIQYHNFQLDKFTFSPEKEAIVIFLNTNYGLQIGNRKDLIGFTITRNMDIKNFGYDPYLESFKDMQDKMHQRFTIY